MATQTSFLLDDQPNAFLEKRSGSFVDNMKLPVHRWFRYSAGFSAQWVDELIAQRGCKNEVILDPFAGSGTTLIAAQQAGCESYGVEAHPFVARIARAKLLYSSDRIAFREFAERIAQEAVTRRGEYPAFGELLQKCFTPLSLRQLDALRVTWEVAQDGSARSELCWLLLVSILRSVSHVGTAPWQYVLPNKSKKTKLLPLDAFRLAADAMYSDMSRMRPAVAPAHLCETDARTCDGVPDKSISLVITSPPYANNYDYADATRLEMTFMREVEGWGDLQHVVRRHLMRSCSQHVPERSTSLAETLDTTALDPIRDEIEKVCSELSAVRLTKGGRKTYHLMIACYFADMARVWSSLRRVCHEDAEVCMVLGDSAPYGVYVPVVEWNGALAEAAGFDSWTFQKIRDRNVKWKNRKHRVPLYEGRLLVRGASNG